MSARTKKGDNSEPADKAGAEESQGDSDRTAAPTNPQAAATPPPTSNASGEAPTGQGDPLAGVTDMPAVQEHAIESATADETARTENIARASTGLVDANGRPFDPAIHEANPDGTPRLSPTGKLRLKRGRGASSFTGTKPAQGATPGQTPTGANVQAEPPKPTATPAEIEMAAKGTMNLVAVGSMILFGPEDGELKREELDNGVQTFSRYYEARGIVKVPPEVAVLAFLVGIGAPRWNRPKAVERRRSFRERFILWYLRMRGKAPIEPDATPAETDAVKTETAPA